MTTNAEHYQVAELLNGKVTLGHFYDYKNDPAGHGNHVHCAVLPWGKPDKASADPPAATHITPNLTALMTAVGEAFPGRYRSLGVCVKKHRNNDLSQPWSQHTFCNANDFAGNGKEQDDLINWLNAEYTGGDDDMALTQDGNESLAFLNGAKERAKGNPKPTKSPNMGDGKDYKGAAEAGWDFANGTMPPVKP